MAWKMRHVKGVLSFFWTLELRGVGIADIHDTNSQPEMANTSHDGSFHTNQRRLECSVIVPLSTWRKTPMMTACSYLPTGETGELYGADAPGVTRHGKALRLKAPLEAAVPAT